MLKTMQAQCKENAGPMQLKCRPAAVPPAHDAVLAASNRLLCSPEAVHGVNECVPPAPAAQLLHLKESLLRVMLRLLYLEVWLVLPSPKQMLPSPHSVHPVAESVPPTPERMAPAPPTLYPLT